MTNAFLDEANRRRRGHVTWYERVSPDLTDDQKRQLDDALDDRRISAQVISDVLSTWGFYASEQAIGNYRRRRAV